MKISILGKCILLVAALGSLSRADDRPNFVLMIADDLGAEDCGPFGNSAVRTPSLNRLAREGIRFNAAFLTCSSCSPSRSSLITGLYPHNTGAMRLHEPLPADRETFVGALKRAGYFTAGAGKWHLGPNHKKDFNTFIEGGRPSGCDNWVKVLRERPRNQPFFLWLASFDPHRDYEPDATNPPHDPAKVAVPPYLPDTPEVRADLAAYYDEICRLDGFVGQVLDELDAQGVAANTLVVFLSDNGRPFPRCKTTVYDSGIRTPLILRWPGQAPAGSVAHGLVSSIDLAPTFLDLAGLSPLPSFQGRSFAQLIHDPTASGRSSIFAEHNWHDFDDHQRAIRNDRYKYIRTAYTDVPLTPPSDAIRSPTFQSMRALRDAGRLSPAQSSVFTAPRPSEELYDLAADPHELSNLASDPASQPILEKLRKELDQWERETADRVPPARTPDRYDRERGQASPSTLPTKPSP